MTTKCASFIPMEIGQVFLFYFLMHKFDPDAIWHVNMEIITYVSEHIDCILKIILKRPREFIVYRETWIWYRFSICPNPEVQTTNGKTWQVIILSPKIWSQYSIFPLPVETVDRCLLIKRESSIITNHYYLQNWLWSWFQTPIWLRNSGQ